MEQNEYRDEVIELLRRIAEALEIPLDAAIPQRVSFGQLSNRGAQPPANISLRWTEREIASLTKLFKRRLTDKEIARVLNRTAYAVRKKRSELGLSTRERKQS